MYVNVCVCVHASRPLSMSLTVVKLAGADLRYVWDLDRDRLQVCFTDPDRDRLPDYRSA